MLKSRLGTSLREQTYDKEIKKRDNDDYKALIKLLVKSTNRLTVTEMMNLIDTELNTPGDTSKKDTYKKTIEEYTKLNHYLKRIDSAISGTSPDENVAGNDNTSSIAW